VKVSIVEPAKDLNAALQQILEYSAAPSRLLWLSGSQDDARQVIRDDISTFSWGPGPNGLPLEQSPARTAFLSMGKQQQVSFRDELGQIPFSKP
jgi:hypothetical protein